MVVESIRKIILSFIFLFTVVFAFAQTQNYFVVTGRITTDDGNSDGTVITVTKNDAPAENINPPRTGRFRFEFEYNNEYQLSFEKDGFFKKIIVISTHVPQEIWERNNEFPPFSFIVNLFKALPGIDKSFTNKPVGKVFYNASIDNFDSEIYFSDIQIEEQIEEAIMQNNELSSEQREINKVNQQDQELKEKDYDKTIKEANAMYQQQQLDAALAKYQHASDLFPDRPYPRDRVAELQDLIAAQKLAEQRQKELMAKYQQAIDQADGLFSSQQYDQAKKIYQQALDIKAGDEYAVGRIAEAENRYKQQQLDMQYKEIIAAADQLFRAANFQKAREKYLQAATVKPDDSYAMGQMAKIDAEIERQAELAELENQYNRAMKEGESALGTQNLEQALKAFQKASNLKNDAPLAKTKVAQVEGLIAQRENESKYNQRIQDADKAYNDGELATAKTLYQEALGFLPQEQYPSQKISEIDSQLKQNAEFEMVMNLANESFQSGDWERSKSLYQDAIKIKADPQINERINEIEKLIADKQLQDQYANLIQEGDDLFVSARFDEAKQAYQKALTLKAGEKYPQDQIAKVEEELAKLAEQAAKEKQYKEAMQEGNQAFSGGQYQQALQAFQRAMANKIDDPVAKQRVADTEQKIAQQETQKRYDAQIASADQAYQAGNLEASRNLYELALGILPNETYPQSQINQINQIVAQNNQFDQYMNQAQQAFSAENYQLAKEMYQQAYDIKSQVELRNRIDEVNQIIKQKEEERIREQERLAALDRSYKAAIDKGNSFLTNNQFDDARSAFTEAKQLKPEELLPEQLIEKANSMQAAYEQQLAAEKAREEARLLAIQQEKDRNYNRAVQAGDSLFTLAQYELAKIQFESANSIKPEENYPVDKIREIDGRIQEIARLTASYKAAVDAGNRLMGQGQYEPALDKFQEALQYLPDEKYPKEQINRLNELIAQQELAEKLERSYQSTLKSADSLFNLNAFAEAKVKFQEASGIKPNEFYPKNKIREIDALMTQIAQEEARKQAIEESYRETIQTADQAFAANDFETAKSTYAEASRIKPEENYPGQQIEKIDQLIRQQIENKYNAAVKIADRLFAEENYSESKMSYNDALAIKPKDQHSTNQIYKIDQILQQQAQAKREKEEMERSFREKMQLADVAFNNKQYRNAKGAYQDALLIKPEELKPVQQIAKIDSILLDIQKQEEINQLYSQAIRDAQDAYRQNQLPEAIGFYKQALTHKPNEPLPKQRIAELETMIAQQEEIERLAKQEEEQRLARIKANQEQYYAAIASADQAFREEKFGPARQFYAQALDAMPEEQYPQNQIAKIDQIIEERAAAEMALKQQAYLDSLNKAQQEVFDLRIAQAEQHVTDKYFQNAIADFQAAIEIIPQRRSEVNMRIEQVRQIMKNLQDQEAGYTDAVARGDQFYQNGELQRSVSAYEEALQYKPEENYPAERIRHIQSELQAIEANYQAAITAADQSFGEQDWMAAKDKYAEALTIKKGEAYPSQQLVVVNQKIREMQEARKAREMTEESYVEAIASGEEALLNDQLTAARMHFEFAKELKPAETYPDVKIKEIDELIAERQRAEEQARQDALVDDQYRQMISQADQAFKEEKYLVAKTKYNLALSIKPVEDYPKKQIQLIDKQLAAENNAPVATIQNEANTRPVIATQPVSAPSVSRNLTVNNYTIVERVSEYDNSIRLGDQAYMQRDYTVAQFYYYKALKEDPNSSYANSRIKEIASLIDQTMLASELTAYNEVIKKADDEFLKKNFNIAQFYYNRGLEIKSWEQYPKDQIEKIRELTNSMLSQKEEEAYRDLIAKADEAFYKKEFAIAKSYYTKSMGIKNDEQYPQIKIKEVEKLVKEELKNEETQQYKEFLAEGDRALFESNYGIARFYYNKALGIKPQEKYPKEQLQKIKELVYNKQ